MHDIKTKDCNFNKLFGYYNCVTAKSANSKNVVLVKHLVGG